MGHASNAQHCLHCHRRSTLTAPISYLKTTHDSWPDPWHRRKQQIKGDDDLARTRPRRVIGDRHWSTQKHQRHVSLKRVFLDLFPNRKRGKTGERHARADGTPSTLTADELLDRGLVVFAHTRRPLTAVKPTPSGHVVRTTPIYPATGPPGQAASVQSYRQTCPPLRRHPSRQYSSSIDRLPAGPSSIGRSPATCLKF